MGTIDRLFTEFALTVIYGAYPVAGGRDWCCGTNGIGIHWRLGRVTAEKTGEPLEEIGWP